MLIIADENIPHVEETFGHLGEIRREPGRTLTAAQVRDAEVLLVRSVTAVNAQLLAGSAVRFVGSATIGVDHLDLDYLKQQGITWANAPGSNANSVVEYVISALCRLDGALQQLLSGARVGIVGLGNVGGQLYRRLDRLGIECVGYDPLLDPHRYPILTGFEEVMEADVICLHTPLTESGPYPTRHLLNEAVLEQLKPGTLILNAGRGAVIDNAALYEVLQHRDDLCVVLDVWENEPEINQRLMQRVDLATPHIAGYSYDGKLAGTQMIYEACCDYLGEPIRQRLGDVTTLTPLKVQHWAHTGETPVEAVRKVVLAAYDIAEDDQRLRGAVNHRGEVSIGQVFDRLRREYPRRREFNRFRVALPENATQSLHDLLADLGFSLD